MLFGQGRQCVPTASRSIGFQGTDTFTGFTAVAAAAFTARPQCILLLKSLGYLF